MSHPSCIGDTYVVQETNREAFLHSVVRPPDLKGLIDMLRKQNKNPQDRRYIRMTHLIAMRRVLKSIAGFLGLSTRLTGTMGEPATPSEVIYIVHEVLEYALIAGAFYFRRTPYALPYLRTWAFADYLVVAREWDDAEHGQVMNFWRVRSCPQNSRCTSVGL